MFQLPPKVTWSLVVFLLSQSHKPLSSLVLGHLCSVLNGVPKKYVYWLRHGQIVIRWDSHLRNVNLFGKSIFKCKDVNLVRDFKVTSSIIWVTMKTSVLIRDKDIYMERSKAMWRKRQRSELCSQKSRYAWSHQRESSPANTLFFTSCLQNCERIIFFSHQLVIIFYDSPRKLI